MTLPPPEWSAPAAAHKPPTVTVSPPGMARHTGARAEEATLRARLAASRMARNPAAVRSDAVALARWLASRDRGLADAVALASEALALADDDELRRDLAAWHESLGALDRAASTLRPLGASRDADASDVAHVLVRVGVLSARAGDLEHADEALAEAMRVAPDDARAAELRGAVAAAAPSEAARDHAVAAYVEAASRREAEGARDAQLENLARAFNLAPTSGVAARALARALEARGRAGAADEVWRAHAAARAKIVDGRVSAIHATRRASALAAADPTWALGAALDAGLDAEFEGEGATAFDEALTRVGLAEVVAARLELRAERATGEARARAYEALGRLAAGPLGSAERAFEAYACAVASYPARDEGLMQLRARAAATGDTTWLIEALIRVGLGDATPLARGGVAAKASRSANLACLRELATLAESTLGDVRLAAWAHERVLAIEPEDAASLTWTMRSGDRVRAAKRDLDTARRALAATTAGDAKHAGLMRALAERLAGSPTDGDELARLLAELARTDGSDAAWRAFARRIAWRRGDSGLVARLAMDALGRANTAREKIAARADLAAAARAQGDAALASDEARELLVDAPGERAAAGLAWIAAALAGDGATRARAIAQLARGCTMALRALLLAVAAEALASRGERAEARRLADEAKRADPESARAITELANALVGLDERAAITGIEQAVAATFPRAAWLRAIATSYEAIGELGLALDWSAKLVSLVPGDHEALETYVARAVRSRDADRIGEVLMVMIAQPLPALVVGELYGTALLELSALDALQSLVLARRALDVFGPVNAPLRRALLDVARRANDPAFGAAVLERLLATSAAADDRRRALPQLAALREEVGDHDGVARALFLAAREGVSAAVIGPRLVALAGMPLSGDGELARIEAHIRLSTQEGDAAATSRAFRELGAALWDLVGDRDGALDAWIQAAESAPALGYAILGADLARFGEPRFALDALLQRMASERDPVRLGALTTEAARAALATGNAEQALDLARRALELAPSGDALAIAERSTQALGRTAEMTGFYDYVGERALGRFGRRAAHYRGARFFEARGDVDLALKHAASAFAAVPSAGSTFALLTRAAELASDVERALGAVEAVSEAADSPRARAAWLLRAASMAERLDDAAARRLDLLLRAALSSPDLGTLALLRDAGRTYLAAAPAESGSLELRIARASNAIAERLDGPDGARIAIGLVELSLALFDVPDAAVTALARALACDADVDELSRLVPAATRLARARGARDLVVQTLASAERPYTNVGASALGLLAALAAALDDRALYARALILAAGRSPDDAALARDAEVATRDLDDPMLTSLLGKTVPIPRRVEALRSLAATRLSEGAHADAIAALEQAATIADGPLRIEVGDELRAMYETSGRGTDVEARAMREAMNLQNTAFVRAQQWAELAARREARHDMRGAVAALYAAAKCEPDSVERWSALERVAELSGNVEARIEALGAIAERVTADGKVAVQKRLARALEARGDVPGATEAWRTVLSMEPDDEEADQALEGFIVAEARYADLAFHLGRRAERLSGMSGQRERLRALRLRRTAILEQRLGRIDDACDELALLLAEWPDNASALRYLADLHERMGEHGRAAPLWRRVATLERDPHAKSELELRAAKASHASGDTEMALTHVRAVLERSPTSRDALLLRIAIARSVGNDRELGDALEAAAGASQDDAATRSALLVEAAQASARAGDMLAALGRAQRGAATAPESAATQLLARGLEYRLRGVGAPADARVTLEELGKIRGGLEPDDEALCALLLAEALDAVHGGGAGMRELVARREELGLHVLIALGIAERLNSQGSFAAALPMFEKALSGNLFGLRRRGGVALAAADAAIRCEQPAAARRFLDEAASDPDTRPAALRKLAQLEARLTQAKTPAPAMTTGRESALSALETTARCAATAEERAAARLALARAYMVAGDARAAETNLETALLEGSLDAGVELAMMLEQTPDRASDLVRVRKQIADLMAGDVDALLELKAAASSDENVVYVRALDHLVRAFDPAAGPLPPPPLGAQREQPGLLTFLMRGTDPRATEAFALAWDGAASLFTRDPSTYHVTGMERIVSGATSPLGRLYDLARRLLEAPKIPVFVKRVPGALSSEIALLTQPAVILAGEPDADSAELRYVLGCGLASALPASALLLGQPEPEARRTFRALLGAFGPPEFGRRMDTPTAKLAERFWQVIPARTQRRLQEVLAPTPAPDFDEVLRRARQSTHRVGLFLSGDFEAAVAAILRDHASRDLATLRGPNGLRRLSLEIPEIADLVRLASSREYADARWQPSSTLPPRGMLAGRA